MREKTRQDAQKKGRGSYVKLKEQQKYCRNDEDPEERRSEEKVTAFAWDWLEKESCKSLKTRLHSCKHCLEGPSCESQKSLWDIKKRENIGLKARTHYVKQRTGACTVHSQYQTYTNNVCVGGGGGTSLKMGLNNTNCKIKPQHLLF